MRPPTSPIQAVDPTLKIHYPGTGAAAALPATDRLSVDSTPLPPLPDPNFPRVRGYEIISIVGCGGMGIVYEARHRELNRRVAIKTLRGEALADPEFRDRFRAEAEAIAKLQHPNIIQVFEIGTVESLPFEMHPSPFIALEFVDGGSLTHQTHTPQPPRTAAKTVETLARAAHAAHLLGVIHRDLKPANVLLTRDGEPKIADFGIAKQIGVEASGADRAVTRAGTIMGTPEYMAPEQLDGREASPAIDIYALGVILYELLAGRVPFQGATFSDTMMLAMRQEPVPPSRLQPGVPRDLETICLKCLEKAPGNRYESAEALADDLARFAEGRPIKARAVGVGGRALRWSRRNPAIAMLSVAVLFVSLVGIAGVVWQWTDARRNAADAQRNAADAHDNAKKAELAAANARDFAEKERWEHYRASVFAASSALRLYDINGARRALDDAPAEYRDWVWKQLHAQIDRSQAVLQGQGTDISSSRFTPSGRWVLLESRDRILRVWNLETHTEYCPTKAEPNLRGGILSRDGATLAYGAADFSIRLVDVTTGKTRATLGGVHKDNIDILEFSADDTQLFSTAFDQTFCVWDAKTGKLQRSFQAPKGSEPPLVHSPDGWVVASRNADGVPRIWDVITGRELHALHGHKDTILTLRFSPQSDQLAILEAFPGCTIRVWDVATGKPLAVLRGHANQITHIDYSRDGKRLVTTSMDRTVRVWDTRTERSGDEIEASVVLRGHTGWVEYANFSPDGTRVVSCSHDRTVRYWNAKTGEQLAVLCGHTAEVQGAAWVSNGQFLASAAADGTVRLWDISEVERGYAIRGHAKFAYAVAFFPDGERIVSTAWDGTARVWHATTGRQLFTFDHGDDLYVAHVAVHPAGRMIATLARHPKGLYTKVRLWDVATNRVLQSWTIPSGWQDGRVAFSPDGNLLVAGAADGSIHMWDVKTRTEVAVLKGHSHPVRDVAFSPNGKWLASAGDNGDCTVGIWDVETKQKVQTLRGHSMGVYSLAWNPDGTLLASGAMDNAVRLWDTTTWREVGVLKNGSWVYGVAFTTDGKLLAAACRDNLIRVWDVRAREELAELSGHIDYVHSLAFSGDGTRLISASGDWTLRAWDTILPGERAKRSRAESLSPGAIPR